MNPTSRPGRWLLILLLLLLGLLFLALPGCVVKIEGGGHGDDGGHHVEHEHGD